MVLAARVVHSKTGARTWEEACENDCFETYKACAAQLLEQISNGDCPTKCLRQPSSFVAQIDRLAQANKKQRSTLNADAPPFYSVNQMQLPMPERYDISSNDGREPMEEAALERKESTNLSPSTSSIAGIKNQHCYSREYILSFHALDSSNEFEALVNHKLVDDCGQVRTVARGPCPPRSNPAILEATADEAASALERCEWPLCSRSLSGSFGSDSEPHPSWHSIRG